MVALTQKWFCAQYGWFSHGWSHIKNIFQKMSFRAITWRANYKRKCTRWLGRTIGPCAKDMVCHGDAFVRCKAPCAHGLGRPDTECEPTDCLWHLWVSLTRASITDMFERSENAAITLACWAINYIIVTYILVIVLYKIKHCICQKMLVFFE